FDPTRRREGRDWPLFGYTMVGEARLAHVQACLEDVVARGVPGDAVEAGVWRGGTALYMRAVLDRLGATQRRVWAADSFRGMPAPSGHDGGGPDLSGVGALAVPLERVQAAFRRFDLLDERVRFLEGWFADTLPTAPIGAIALLRLDGDTYRSTRDALLHLYDRVQPGGWVIVDDYHSWRACRAAVDDFLAGRGLRPALTRVDWTAASWRVPE
ncbi:MAG: TylF/MycF/NovP-related O-methyltransferase, partial [Myxococcota bacterium]|nr:TylF/MycF/NovP-related O-methyltransferase [Myxococcota bacterium]